MSDIGQAVSHRSLPARRNNIAQKFKVTGQLMLYLSVHDDAQPVEVFLHAKGPDCFSELIGLHEVIARLMSLTLQYDAPLEEVGDLLAAAKCVPCGHVVEHDRIKYCSNLQEIIGRHLLSSRDRRYSILPPCEILPIHHSNQSLQERSSL